MLLSARCFVESDSGGDSLEKIPFVLQLVLGALGTVQMSPRRLSASEQFPQCLKPHARIVFEVILETFGIAGSGVGPVLTVAHASAQVSDTTIVRGDQVRHVVVSDTSSTRRARWTDQGALAKIRPRRPPGTRFRERTRFGPIC
jgi:hypothetical protein